MRPPHSCSVFPRRGLRASSIAIRVQPSTIKFQCRSLATVANTHETGFKIPIIDFSIFLRGGETEKKNCANEILEGFTSSGFVYLKDVGIPKDTVSNAFAWSKRFFELSLEQKLKVAWETPESNRGYVAPGREKVSRLLSAEDIEKVRAAAPDLKESLEIGKEPSDNYQVFSVTMRLTV